MKNVQWKVNCLSTPKIIRHCKKCHKDTEFICSEMFRVNAQKKNLDIWLIYNCEQCKTSWNATIFSRVNSNKINLKMLDRFLANDPKLVKKYSLDKTTLKKNGVYIQALDYEIIGEKFHLSESVKLEISSEYPVDIKLSTLIKRKLALSNTEFKRLFLNGQFEKFDNHEARKKLNDSLIVYFKSKEIAIHNHKKTCLPEIKH